MKAIYNFSMRIVVLQLMLMMFAAAYANSPDKDTLSGDPELLFHPAPEMKVHYDPVQPNAMLAGESLAYGNDVWASILFTINPANPASTTGVGAVTFQSASGDFLPDDPAHMYVIDLVDNHLKKVDVATAGVVNSMPMAPATADEVWTVLSTDKTTMSDMYAISTNGSESFLYQMDPVAGTVELLTPLGIGAVISGTFAGSPGVMLVLDALTDVCYSINVADASITELGPAGFDANFAQGMGYDPATGHVYLAAYHNDVGPELRQMNVLTGETTLLGSLPGETTAFAFPVPTEDLILLAGQDQYLVTGGSFSFGEEGDFPPLPPDFFGPGSEPFTGTVPLHGQNSDGGQLPMADFRLNRTEDLPLPAPPPSTGTVDVEIVELGLKSVEPIAVNIGGADSFFDVFVTLQPAAPQAGNADITQENAQGGVFGMNLLVYPVFIFVNVDNPSNEIIFDPFEAGLAPLPLLPPDPMDWMLPPVPGEFDPFFPDPEPLLTPSGSGINVLPLLLRDDQVFLSMNQEGVPEEWSGSGYNLGEWFYYPNTDWWNVWFYDHPVDVTRRKLVGGFLEVLPRDPSMPSYVEIVINWSTPQWPGFPETLRPPLPEDVQDPIVEEQMIERSETIFLFEGGSIDEPIPVEIPSDYLNNNTNLFNFNPEWLSIDLRGYNFQLQGDIVHICFKPYDGCSFEIICPPDIEVCFTDEPFALTGGQPAGGTYSGPGVVSGTHFDPSTASWGSNTITYTYTDDSGCTKSCQFTIYVIPPPEMVCPPNLIVCADDNSVSLSGGIPAGGTYSGPGVSGNTFFPSAAGLGTHTITYAVTDPCPGSCTFEITVVAPPEIICPDDFTMCQDDDPINLQNYVSPSGGTFLGGNIFDPSGAPAGVPLQFNYTYTDPATGCDAHCTFYITVYPEPEVICPDDMVVCEDDPVIDLSSLGASPSGGTFTDAIGNVITIFDPAGAGPASYLITYSYTDPQTGCTGECEFAITVYPNPEVDCPDDMTLCEGDGEVTLSASPAGGTFSGPGVDGSTFDPAGAGDGVHTIEYCYTDPDTGCEGCCEFTVTVHPDPDVVCPENMMLCVDDFPVNLSGTPAGGTFSGPGINGNQFDPAAAGVGVHTIEYCYTDPDTGCEGCCEFTVIVNPKPDVTCPPDMHVCIDEPPFNLTGATPPGGSYNDVNFNPVNPFDPAAFGVGVHTIYYDYVDPNTGCYNFCTFTVTVHDLPVVTCPPNMSVCEDDLQFLLTGATPAGGIYSGPGVVGINQFNPSATGPGLYFITYTYTDQYGCSNSCVFSITVNPLPNVICPPDDTVCFSDNVVPLPAGMPAGGTYAGPGVVGGNGFIAAQAGVGTHTLIYTWTDPVTGCSNSCPFIMTVLPSPVVICPPNISVCVDSQPFPLAGATPAGGTYFDAAGNPVVNFNPAWGAGSYPITYVYTDPQTGCTGQCTFIITVNPLPAVNCPGDTSICEGSPVFMLTGATPAGGVYAGTGVSFVGGNYWYDPAVWGLGTVTITYTYTDPATGCVNSCNFDITTNALPLVDCPADMTVCESDAPFVLTGGEPEGGTYTDPAGNPVVAFDPGIGTGVYPITYSWTDPATGCSNSCMFTITVAEGPSVDCPPDMEVCFNDAPFALTGAVPFGGTYTGPGVSGGVFYPAVAGTGAHLITYTYTDPQTGCSGSCTFSVIVNGNQVIEMNTGWNGISTYIIPDDPDIVNMFAPIENSLTILYNLSGLNSTGTLYWPSQGIMPSEDWDVYSGYFIKVGDPVDLILCGLEVIDKTLQLPQGWSLIPVLSNFEVNAEDLFDGVDELVVVKDAAGPGVYWPAFNINSLGHLKPGRSYLVYLSGEAEITYPSTQVTNSVIKPEHDLPGHPWGEIVETPASHVVVFNAASSPIEHGDLIGGFTSSGHPAGVAEADERNNTFAISLYGNDPYSETVTGFGEGEEFSFRLFRPSTGETFDLEVVYNPEMNTGFFTPNGLSEVKELKVSSTGVGSAEVSPVEIFPNPSEGAFNIKGIEGHATVIILNAFGEEILREEMKLPSEINLISQPKGMYVVVIRTFDGQEVIRKLIIH